MEGNWPQGRMSRAADAEMEQPNLVLPINREEMVEGLAAVLAALQDMKDRANALTEEELAAFLHKKMKEAHAAIVGFQEKLVEDLDQEYVNAIPEREAARILDMDVPEALQMLQQHEVEEENEEEEEEHDAVEYAIMDEDGLVVVDHRQFLELMRTLLRNTGNLLFDFETKDAEDLADVLLSATRILLDMAEGATAGALRSLQPDYDFNAQAHARVNRVEELDNDGQPRPSSPAPSAHRRGGYHHGPPQRVLWQPLGPQLLAAVRDSPQTFWAHPFKTTAVVAGLLAASVPLAVCLPGVLLSDALLQYAYTPVASEVDRMVHNGKEMTRLTYVVTRITLRKASRVARAGLRDAYAHPTETAKNVGAVVWEATTHPVATLQGAYGIAKVALDPVWTILKAYMMPVAGPTA